MTDGVSLPRSLLSVLFCYLLASLSPSLPPSVALFSSRKVETPGPERIEYREKIVEVEVENHSMKQVDLHVRMPRTAAHCCDAFDRGGHGGAGAN